jgi:RNA polymerase sigma-70 factor (ECF subfamily)
MEKVILAETPLTRAAAVDFEALVNAHARFVFKIAFSIVRNAEDAEDVVQETFFRAFRSGDVNKVERMRAWLARIAWRLAVDRIRRRSTNRRDERSEDLLLLLPANAVGAEEALLNAERQALLERLLRALPHDLRETLQLATVEGMTSAEVAELLGIEESSVRTRVSRARKQLKERLAAMMEGNYGP